MANECTTFVKLTEPFPEEYRPLFTEVAGLAGNILDERIVSYIHDRGRPKGGLRGVKWRFGLF